MHGELLFVYGTLRRGERRHRLLLPHCRYLGTGVMRGKLYQVAEYPGMVESQRIGDRVIGEVYRVRQSERLFARLDEYEQCSAQFAMPHEYVRKKLPLLGKHGAAAWVYIFQREVRGLVRLKKAWRARGKVARILRPAQPLPLARKFGKAQPSRRGGLLPSRP